MIKHLAPWLGRRYAASKYLPESSRFDSAQAISISNADELYALQPGFLQVLDQEFQVESLAGRLCPVLMEDQSVALFALSDHVGSDQADELARRMVQQGYRLSQPTRYILTAPLLLAVGRRQLLATNVGTQSIASAENNKTALADAFQEMLEWGVRKQASDLHINLNFSTAVSEVRYTIAGRYIAPECFRGMPTSMLRDMLAVAWMDIRGGNGAVFDPYSEQQGSVVRTVDNKALTLRWASLAAEQGASVCLRLLVRDPAKNMPSLEDLGYFPEQIQQIQRAVRSDGGAVVFAGTVGSGKSTTLASLISCLPDHHKVITLEDPVEYLIPRAIQNTVARVLDDETGCFSTKLRALKRSAMSDVLLGEIRDRETGMAFMDLAGSGVNVYSTVHAPSAALVPERLASDFIAISRDFLATPGILKLLVYQALLPTLCQHCALPATADLALELTGIIAELYDSNSDHLRFRNPEGCVHCRQAQLSELAGYAGRTVAAEILEPALATGYLDSLQHRRLPGWLAHQASDPECKPTAMDNAMRKALQGLIDPRDIEVRFQSFQTLLLARRLKAAKSGVISSRLRLIS